MMTRIAPVSFTIATVTVSSGRTVAVQGGGDVHTFVLRASFATRGPTLRGQRNSCKCELATFPQRLEVALDVSTCVPSTTLHGTSVQLGQAQVTISRALVIDEVDCEPFRVKGRSRTAWSTRPIVTGPDLLRA